VACQAEWAEWIINLNEAFSLLNSEIKKSRYGNVSGFFVFMFTPEGLATSLGLIVATPEGLQTLSGLIVTTPEGFQTLWGLIVAIPEGFQTLSGRTELSSASSFS
jgi:hypothetical protein